MIQEILDAGWKEMIFISPIREIKNRKNFEKGNYWLTFDNRKDYVNHPFIEITIRDPALESERVGDNRGTHWFAFKYKGLETLEHLDKLLIF